MSRTNEEALALTVEWVMGRIEEAHHVGKYGSHDSIMMIGWCALSRSNIIKVLSRSIHVKKRCIVHWGYHLG